MKGINYIDIEKWDREIKEAEAGRLNDRSLMDIIGAKEIHREAAAAATCTSASDTGENTNGTDIEWIQLALNIEEKQ